MADQLDVSKLKGLKGKALHEEFQRQYKPSGIAAIRAKYHLGARNLLFFTPVAFAGSFLLALGAVGLGEARTGQTPWWSRLAKSTSDVLNPSAQAQAESALLKSRQQK